jgi:GH15 family glucan-1,4-alpha-glucosidase
MYTIDGRADLKEAELPHLDGYAGSKPVRIGNAAHAQLQLDIFILTGGAEIALEAFAPGRFAR